MSFQIVEDGRLSGEENMRRDAALLASAAPAIRMYEWDGAWVSLGRFQNPARDLLEPSLVPWVMRPSGGKAVLHGHDLTVAIADALDGDGRDLKSVYRRLIAPLVSALRELGFEASLAEDTPFTTKEVRTSDCFRHISPNDVVDTSTGRKLLGCALRVTRTAVLAQCSIPVAMPLIDPARVYEEAHVAMPLGAAAAELRAAIRGCKLLRC